MFIAKFDKNGYRCETYIATEYTEEQKTQMYADGFVDLSEDDWNYYVGNMGAGDNGTGYVRDMTTGKPVSAPPAPKPSKAQRISQLEQDYSKARFELGTYYMEAVLDGNVEVQKDLQTEMADVKAEYEEAVTAIMNEEE